MDGSDKASILGIDSKIVDAIKAIEDSQRRIALVLSDEKKLLGTLTDGDIGGAFFQWKPGNISFTCYEY